MQGGVLAGAMGGNSGVEIGLASNPPRVGLPSYRTLRPVWTSDPSGAQMDPVGGPAPYRLIYY
jgi:hypothetical protein